MKDPILRYTIPARLLLVAMIVLPIAGTGGLIYCLYESLPSGRYPIIVFAMPFVVVAFLGFHLGSVTLRKLGIRVRHDDIILPSRAVTSSMPQTEDSTRMRIVEIDNEFCDLCEKDVAVDEDGRCPICGYPV